MNITLETVESVETVKEWAYTRKHLRTEVRFWDGETEEAPMGGEETSYGFYRIMSVDDYNGKYRMSEDSVTYLEVPGTVWGDYCGSVYNRSNMRRLLEDYPDTFVTVGMDFSSTCLLLPLNSAMPEGLGDILDGLEDYPIYDESDLSELETEMTDEAWDRWGAWDLRRDLEKALGDDSLEDVEDDALREAWWAACEVAGFYPYAEDATNMILWDGHVLEALKTSILG